MRLPTLVGIAFFGISLGAQTKIESIATQIESIAALEEPRLGLDTRIHAAERLQLVDPSTAKRILDGALPMLSKPVQPTYLAFRFLNAYAFIDLDGAEKVSRKIPDKDWVYTALIQRSAEVRDFKRADRLIQQAEQDGYYALGVVRFALRKMKLEMPGEAARVLQRRVDVFPTARATYREVRELLSDLAVFPEVDTQLAREALRKIFEAIDRPGFRDNDTDREMTAMYTLGRNKIQTDTTYETVLLASAAYLAVFNPPAYLVRLGTLPEWRSHLTALQRPDLPGLDSAHIVMRQRRTGPPPTPESEPRVQSANYLRASYEDAVRDLGKLDRYNRLTILKILAGRIDLTDAQRKEAFEELFIAAGELPIWERYNVMRTAFYQAAESKIEGIFGPAVHAWIETLDAAAKSDDPMLLGAHEHREYQNFFSRIAELFDGRDYALPQPHPSIAAYHAFRALDRAAYESVDFSLMSMDGKQFHLAELKSKIVMIDFWATWCPPCRDALPAIDKIHREWSGKGLVVLGISDEPRSVLQSFAAKNPLSYPTLLDEDRKIHNLFGQDGNTQGIPLTVVFDREGKFVDTVPYPHNEASFLVVLKKAGLSK